MFTILFLLLLSPLSTKAFPLSHWAGQLIWQIDQSPFVEDTAPQLTTPEVSAASSAVSLVYQFDGYTKLENLAARSNGHLLLSAVSHPIIHYLDPHSFRPKPKVLYTFPKVTSMLGIAETTPDFFVVAAGNFSTTTFEGVPGSFSVWSIDFTTNKPTGPTVKMITAIPEADALNGLTNIEGSPDLVLISDSRLGAIWRVNTKTGEYSMAIQHVLFTNCTTPFPLGINGITTQDSHVYFINSAQRLYGRIPIDASGAATTEPEIIARSLPAVTAFDDVVIDWEGNGWIATHPNAVTEITPVGKQRNVTADDAKNEIKAPTSLVWGRGSKDAEKMLYLTTAGSQTSAGQVISVDTRLM